MRESLKSQFNFQLAKTDNKSLTYNNINVVSKEEEECNQTYSMISDTSIYYNLEEKQNLP